MVRWTNNVFSRNGAACQESNSPEKTPIFTFSSPFSHFLSLLTLILQYSTLKYIQACDLLADDNFPKIKKKIR